MESIMKIFKQINSLFKKIKKYFKTFFRREYVIYYVLAFLSVTILAIAMISGELSIEILSAKLINLSLGGGAVYLIKTFDFKGVNFTNEIFKGNNAAALAFAGICLLVGLVLSAN
jgi:hypothetical protein